MEEISTNEAGSDDVPLIKKDKSLLNMLTILVGIIVIMGYLTFFVEDPFKAFSGKSEKQVVLTDDRTADLNQSSTMSDEEVRQSLVKFIEAFYQDQRRGYFDPPSYFAPITETFYNFHNLTYERLKGIYWKRRQDMENLKRNWIVSSLDFTRQDSKITAIYWAKEDFFKASLQQQQSMDVKYEMVINEEGKIVSLREIEIRDLEVVETVPDSTSFDPVVDGNASPENIPASGEQIFDISAVEQAPEYPGGQKEWQNYLVAHTKYPFAAKTANVQGKVFVSFVVEKDGSIQNVKIRQGLGSGCDEEAIRVVKASQAWKPGTMKGTAVRTYCIFPVSFPPAGN